jgi:uncharacterized membrane protein YphA (DoxX/SURF4 family)
MDGRAATWVRMVEMGNGHWVERTGAVVRIFLGCVFAISGVSKLVSPGSAALLIANLLGTKPAISNLFTVALSLVEVIIAYMLVFRKRVLVAAVFSVLFMLGSVFVGFLFVENPVSCGCFGALIDFKTDETFLIRNMLFLFASLFVLGTFPETKKQEE